ncbi:hypothetical protein Goari_012170 [Gossypium aridum]|uniref:Uncharacterized protein n=1 Tax=Gossypium aridum TaxID=34290 RepID=A0A7J8WZI4_GOSAI|nr:hypothetical protein [Gossypium aridum]
MSELWDFTRISVTQNNLRELKKIWDLVPTVEEYTTLLHCPRIQADKAYFRAGDLILAYLDTKKRADVFALSIFRSLSTCWRVGEGRFIWCA